MNNKRERAGWLACLLAGALLLVVSCASTPAPRTAAQKYSQDIAKLKTAPARQAQEAEESRYQEQQQRKAHEKAMLYALARVHKSIHTGREWSTWLKLTGHDYDPDEYVPSLEDLYRRNAFTRRWIHIERSGPWPVRNCKDLAYWVCESDRFVSSINTDHKKTEHCYEKIKVSARGQRRECTKLMKMGLKSNKTLDDYGELQGDAFERLIASLIVLSAMKETGVLNPSFCREVIDECQKASESASRYRKTPPKKQKDFIKQQLILAEVNTCQRFAAMEHDVELAYSLRGGSKNDATKITQNICRGVWPILRQLKQQIKELR